MTQTKTQDSFYTGLQRNLDELRTQGLYKRNGFWRRARAVPSPATTGGS